MPFLFVYLLKYRYTCSNVNRISGFYQSLLSIFAIHRILGFVSHIYICMILILLFFEFPCYVFKYKHKFHMCERVILPYYRIRPFQSSSSSSRSMLFDFHVGPIRPVFPNRWSGNPFRWFATSKTRFHFYLLKFDPCL